MEFQLCKVLCYSCYPQSYFKCITTFRGSVLAVDSWISTDIKENFEDHLTLSAMGEFPDS